MRKFSLLMLFIFLSVTARGQTAEQRFDQTFQNLAALTRFSVLEAGGTKGTYGTTVGIGLSEAATTDRASYADAILGTPSEQASENNRRWLTVSAMRGTGLPIDFGVAVTQLQGSTTSQIAGILQGTVFEQFGWPAATMRYQYAELIGLRGDNAIKSQSFELLLTQGIWRYFTGYVSAGYENTTVSITVRNEDTLGLNELGELSGTRSVANSILKAGLQISAWPPFLAISGEAVIDQKQNRQVGVKLNWLI
jgi:hypothetical protein